MCGLIIPRIIDQLFMIIELICSLSVICQSNIFSNTERNQFVKVLLYEALCSRKPDPCFVDNSIDIV